ncbi:MAG: hypothetical protein DRO09_03120 [Thermoprotei archaeon]|nr:MAG: hypothetical protein DRO09_03120 [Thermoprotei archaeon]
MWFTFLYGPLGPSVRAKKKFIVSISEDLARIKAFTGAGISLEIKNPLNTLELMELIETDPDVADLIRSGARRFLIAKII